MEVLYSNVDVDHVVSDRFAMKNRVNYRRQLFDDVWLIAPVTKLVKMNDGS